MTVIESIILGIVQGIGEFLPISSSAHLILVPYLFNFTSGMANSEKLAFDVALHLGTLISVIVVFWKSWLNLFNGVFRKVYEKENSFDNRMFWYLVAATIPGAIVGKLFESKIEDYFRTNIFLIVLALAFIGVLIYIGDKWASNYYRNKENSFEKLTFKQTFIIGISQALAIIPGFSRAGITILTGRLLGVSREGVTKFTFLLSTPIIFGAAVLSVKDLVLSIEVIIGIIVSAIVGIICIKFLLKYIKNNDFAIFAYYRLIIALIVIIKLISG